MTRHKLERYEDEVPRDVPYSVFYRGHGRRYVRCGSFKKPTRDTRRAAKPITRNKA